MEKIKFFVDRKVVVWERDFFEVSQSDFDKVKASVENNTYNSYDGEVEPTETGIQFDTLQDVLIEDNDGNPTVEMFMNQGDMSDVCNNKPK